MPRRKKYLNNADMLIQIHLSKNNFCYYSDKKYNTYDIILDHIDLINEENIDLAKQNKVKKIKKELTNKEEKEKITTNTIPLEDLIFRVITYDHIPDEPGRKKNPRTIADTKIKLPFYPFKHYAYIDNKLTEVGRSHWKGDLKNGKFNITGTITQELAKMYLTLVNHYGMRNNWRGYSYLEEMKGQAIVQLSAVGLQFDESKSQNPFAYYTTIINNSFTRVLLSEKRNQDIRDDLLEQNNVTPSHARQTRNEEDIEKAREIRIKKYKDNENNN